MTYRVWLRDEENDDKSIDVDSINIQEGGVLHCRIQVENIDIWYSPAEWTTVEHSR